MRPHDWSRFLLYGLHPIAVAQVSPELAEHLGASKREVLLGREYALKIVAKHGLAPEHFPAIFDSIDFGHAIADRDRHLTFLHRHEEWSGWFQASVKRCTEKRLIYLTTFHRLRESEVSRKLRKHPLVRAGK